MFQGFNEPSVDDNILEVVAVLGAHQMVWLYRYLISDSLVYVVLLSAYARCRQFLYSCLTILNVSRGNFHSLCRRECVKFLEVCHITGSHR